MSVSKGFFTGKLGMSSPRKSEDLCAWVLWVSQPCPSGFTCVWVAGVLATSHLKHLYFFSFLFSPPPLELTRVKAGPSGRINAPWADSRPIGDNPVSQFSGGKTLRFALHGVSRVLGWVKDQLFIAKPLSLVLPLLSSLRSLL